MVGTSSTMLIVLRGPCGCGKSTTATLLREAYAGGRGLAIVRQDQVRRDVLRERDEPDAFNISLIDTMVRAILDAKIPCVLEGIMKVRKYGSMLQQLIADHAGATHTFYWDVPFETTEQRHFTKPNCDDWSVEDMRSWYTPHDTLLGDHIFDEHVSQEQAVAAILAQTGLLLTPPPPYPSLAADVEETAG